MCKKVNYWLELGQRRCHCGRQLLWNKGCSSYPTTEHMVPQSAGGRNFKSNLIILCERCNSHRGNRNFIEWVINNDFPKKEWMIKKYLEALTVHVQNGVKPVVKKRDYNLAGALRNKPAHYDAQIKHMIEKNRLKMVDAAS